MTLNRQKKQALHSETSLDWNLSRTITDTKKKRPQEKDYSSPNPCGANGLKKKGRVAYFKRHALPRRRKKALLGKYWAVEGGNEKRDKTVSIERVSQKNAGQNLERFFGKKIYNGKQTLKRVHKGKLTNEERVWHTRGRE